MIGKKGNKYVIDEENHIAKILLHRRSGEDLWTTIDLEDLERVLDFPYTWFAKYNHTNSSYYVVTSVYHPELKQSRPLFLHQFLMNAHGDVVDHKNNDSLDNRKSNLRIVCTNDNLKNRKSKNKNNTSGYRNVYWDSRREMWVVQLFVDGKNKVFGRFPQCDVDKAGDLAEELRRKYYGDFAGRS